MREGEKRKAEQKKGDMKKKREGVGLRGGGQIEEEEEVCFVKPPSKQTTKGTKG